MTQFAQSLKTWRKSRRYSQLELASEADVSSRHVSFLESGRANPSREMIEKLGDALELPLAARNQLLSHAGFAMRYPQRKWEADEMAPIRAAVDYTLNQHAPYPAFAVDRLWTIVQMNEPAERLFDMVGLTLGQRIIDIVLRPEVQALIENWPDVARHFAQRLRTESAAQGGVEELDATADAIASDAPSVLDASNLEPVVPTIYRVGELRFSLFSTIAQFGTPEDLTLDDLRIELFFPSDKATDEFLKAMASAPTQ